MPGVLDIFDSKKRRFNREMKEERREVLTSHKSEQKRTIDDSLENLVYLTNREASYARDLNRMYEGEYEVLEWRPPVYVEREIHPGGEVRWVYNIKDNSTKRMVDLLERGLVALIDCNIAEVDRNLKVKGRTIRVKVKTYSGIPVQRLDADRMGRLLPKK